jgi:hypothetical protein
MKKAFEGAALCWQSLINVFSAVVIVVYSQEQGCAMGSTGYFINGKAVFER